MALKVIEGVVEEVGHPSPVAGEAGQAWTMWAFIRFNRTKQKPLTLEQVVADAAMGARVVAREAGRFAFYRHEGRLVLCGFAGTRGIEIAKLESDPAAIAADAIRLPAKRKILLGVVLIPTIIGLFFAFDMIKAGRATLKAHPAPKRPGDRRLTRALKGQLYWPF